MRLGVLPGRRHDFAFLLVYENLQALEPCPPPLSTFMWARLGGVERGKRKGDQICGSPGLCACLLQPLRRTRVGKTFQAAPGGPFCRARAGSCNVTATSVFSATYAYQTPDTSAPRDYRTLTSPFLRPSALLAPLRSPVQLSLLPTAAPPEPPPSRLTPPISVHQRESAVPNRPHRHLHATDFCTTFTYLTSLFVKETCPNPRPTINLQKPTSP